MPFPCFRCKSEIDPSFKACPFCGEAITDFVRRHHDQPVDGKYKILSILGAGGMGEVYKVLHVHLNAVRVIKLMLADIASDQDADERFLREAQLATRIHHPNVATLFDFSKLPNGTHYMVWEYIEGKNLHEIVLENGPLSPRHAASLAYEALMGLDAIHRAGIIHRDISPENIMVHVDEDGVEHVKIIDLGIAKQTGSEVQHTSTGMFVGKWKYCSPEHLGVLEKGERIDARADLYSFGIVFYEMLTGATPFQATTPHGYLLLHSSEEPPPLRQINPTVRTSPELEAILFRALAKDRNHRFPSAREFAKALKPLIENLDDAVPARPVPRNAELLEEFSLPAAAWKDPDATAVSRGATVPAVEKPLELPVADSDPTVRVGAVPGDPTTRATVVVPQPARKRRTIAPAVIVIVIAILAAGAYLLMNRRDVPATATTSTAPPVVAANVAPPPLTGTAPAATVDVAPAAVAVNAFPWARVTRIRNTATGESLPVPDDMVTPAVIDVDPGTWEVELVAQGAAEPVTRRVEVLAGQTATLNVTMTEPEAVTLPDLGGSAQ